MCLPIKVERPDYILLEGKHNGLEFAVSHNGSGHRCGYVRVERGHPWYGIEDIHDPVFDDVEVHGRITFSRADVECDQPGEDDAWWVGFDCAHCEDAIDLSLPIDSPEYAEVLKDFSVLTESCRIRDTDYVVSECRQLIAQAIEAAHD